MSVYRCQVAAGPLDAKVTLPGSKSITNRAFIAAALAKGTSLLTNVLLADDTRLMIEALRVLGITITVDERDSVAEITGCNGRIPSIEATLSCGNSGTTLRFCTALVALGQGRFELDGVPRMRQRPVDGLVGALQTLGAGVEYIGREGYPPITVHAKGLRGGRVTVPSPLSSQWVSALLLAAPCANGDVLMEVIGDIPSVPYLKMTTAVMEAFGVAVIEQYDEAKIKYIVEAPQHYQPRQFTIEPDATNASYFLAAPAVAGGRVTIKQLGIQSIQGDVAFADLLEQMGCQVERAAQEFSITGPGRGQPLRALNVDLNAMPDLVPTLAVLALFADGVTTIRNVANLRIKETDRLAALSCELTKLGAKVVETSDGLTISPPEKIQSATLDTYDDHRLAMSFALIGLRCKGIVINNPRCCEKTFPDFFTRFERMAAGVS